MKGICDEKVLYGLWAISALAATSVYAAPVQVGEAAGSAAASVSAGSSSATSVSTVSSAVGLPRRRPAAAMVLIPEPQLPQPPVPSNKGTFNSNHTSVWLFWNCQKSVGFVGRVSVAPPGNNAEKRREATSDHNGLPATAGVLSHYRRAGSFAVG